MLSAVWKRVAVVCLVSSSILYATGSGSEWLKQVPQADRERSNPYANDPKAVLAGKKLFQQHCSACHGSAAEGKGKRPNLHSDTVQNAQSGELQWLLTNGSMKRGMPSWSRLPEQQRWQLVTFLKTLPAQK